MTQQPSIDVHDCQPATDTMLSDVLRGLSRAQKQLPCKYFYDARGSALFEQICETDEYYPTRTELAIMQQNAVEMAELLGVGCMLIEYGSGSSIKTRLLLDELKAPAGYVPIDISDEHLRATAANLNALYPDLEVLPVSADFTDTFALPNPRRAVRRRAIYFPGSTIGNFEPSAARELLAGMHDHCGPGGGLLIGIDLKKNAEVLEAAYDDSAGVTQKFNLNLLRRINRELGADFAPDGFEHRAFYNAEQGRVECHLVSRRPQIVRVEGDEFRFAAGETIHTENSYKYEIDQFAELAATAGWSLADAWTDDESLFAVLFLTA
jgi:dimethylhistidine N-methyltransferase